MEFWKMCFDMKVIDADFLRQAVITDTNKFGDITADQFKQITGEDFIKVSAQ
ncbi:XkdX family protein [Clostridium beijerinckii]|uniref:XkdX family protein n=1 Tax=Clostridium beijerinckii TaxID=1520 RepID=UPI001F2C0A32|nr:XkdX family protein [Clostridium beijerinckii]